MAHQATKDNREREYTELHRARAEYNAYLEREVLPRLGLTRAEVERLGDVEGAKRVLDPKVRRTYVLLAVEMLNANIRYYAAEATPWPLQPRCEPDRVMPVVWALIWAAGGYYVGGAVAALLAAAIGYWAVAKSAERRALKAAEMATEEAAEHNAEVAGWQETINGWNAARDELMAIELDSICEL